MGAPLLERTRELETLAAAVETALDGHSSVVLVSGEAGIGKTSVIREFVAHRMPAGARLLQGACDDLLTPRTFGPLRDAAGTAPGPLAESLRGEAEPEAVYDALLVELAAGPTVLVIEDMHWADDATIDALRHLSRRLDRCRVVLVLTYRDDEVTVDHPLRRLLGALTGIQVERLRLQPLSQAAVGELADLTGRRLATLYRTTAGNPFFVTEALAGSGGAVPPTVVDAVVARVRPLSSDTRAALEQLSVVPTHAEWWLAEALLGDLTVVTEAEEHGIVQGGPEGLSFRHELARQALESALPATRRMALNRYVVDALLAHSGADLSRVVHHAVQAKDVETILSRGPAAAREAARAGSHRQALSHYEQVVTYADRLPDDARAALFSDYSWELYAALRYEDAIVAAEASVEVCEQLDEPVMLGETLVALSRYTYMAGRPAAAVRTVERAVSVLEPTGEQAPLAYAGTYYGALLGLTDRQQEALPVLEVARQQAQQVGRLDLVSLALNYTGSARVELGDRGGIDDLHESLRIAHQVDHHEYVARAYTNLGESLYQVLDFPALRRCIADGLAYARDRDMMGHIYNLTAHQAMLEVAAGRWAEAEARLRELLAGTEEAGSLGRLTVPVLGRLLARRGEPEAQALLQAGWQAARRTDVLQSLGPAGLAVVEAAWLAGDLDSAAEQIDLLLARTATAAGGRYRAELLCYLGRAGRPAAAAPGPDVADSEPSLPEPWASGIRGDWRRAADAWDAVGDVYEAALERGLSGAAPAMLDALELLDRIGAAPAANHVRRRLRALGTVRVPRPRRETTRANPGGLTDRQLDVLALLADGLTNAEIADRLVLSARTVDHHVSAILAKLGVTSRREAGRVAGRLLTRPTASGTPDPAGSS